MGSISPNSAVQSLVDAGLKDLIVYPKDDLYQELVGSYWSNNQKLRPQAFLRPKDTQQVSRVIAALSKTNTGTFALRSGGHTWWQGGSNIEDGITIDLSAMKGTVYDPNTKLATVQAGTRWGEVYSELDKHGVVVCGGRESMVGVGGYTMGGGISWNSARAGFTCDNVVGFEVVLADGRIVNATADNEYADLFLVLKGASSNFGIVTQFIFKTIEGTSVWGGMRITPIATSQQHIEALTDFTTNLESDPTCATAILWAYRPDLGGRAVIHFAMNTTGVEKPAAFEKWLSIPGMDLTKTTTAAQMAVECAQPGGYYVPWMTLTVKNKPSVLQKATELHEKYTEDFNAKFPGADVIVWLAFQPLPAAYGKFSKENGGNVMGYEEKVKDDAQLVLLGILVRDEAMREYAESQSLKWREELEKHARETDTYVDWLYLNYAHGDQDPLSKVGADNIAKIKAAALKYDPSGFFQTRCPGGFKISTSKAWK